MFLNRDDAGERLADGLDIYRDAPDALILGLPRGGVVTAAALSRELRVPLEAFISLKIPWPGDPEIAAGAITETGHVYLIPGVSRLLPSSYLPGRQRLLAQEAWERVKLYRGGRSLPPLSGRTVIVADDGLATGATMLAAVESLRVLGPRRLIAAVPVAPLAVLGTLAGLVDDMAVLAAPEDFSCVAAYYDDFQQVSDLEVLKSLTAARATHPEALAGNH